MNEAPRVDDAASPAQVNGKAVFHSRIADLLDDVTVGGEVAAAPQNSSLVNTPPVAPPAADAAADSAPVAEPKPAPPVPPAPQSPQSDVRPSPSAPPVANQPESGSSSVLPGEPFVGATRRVPPATPPTPPADRAAAPPAASSQAADVPPFLARPAVPRTPGPAEQPAGKPAPLPPATVEDDAPVDGAQAASNQLINIKGRSDGIAVEVGKGSWAEILAALTERLDASGRFFRKGSVALDTGPRPVAEEELQQLAGVLTTHEMSLGIVRTSSERTFQAALALGFTATLESTEGAPVAAATPAATNTDAAAYFVYRGYLRSGHRLRRSENILVIGDINPGAEVISDGDILVWGRLRGIVRAGASGNKRAMVAALDLEPTQLRIADVATMGPDPKPGQPGRFFWRRSQHKRPEIARIVDEAIVLEEWDAARPGGLVSLRRGAG